MIISPHFRLENTKQLLALVAERIAPQLGWKLAVAERVPTARGLGLHLGRP
ncbi:hypothetical protein [Frankia tisae]|uniref:hypothetical protein n=1 Tax=Frankia tisae TaxID=2950104 RepID=UPI0021C0EEB2|nr:hypothetical protein [Frankia tisae]